jgi:hypothetical protein
MVKNMTRKKIKVLTIPQLRKAFVQVDIETKKILSKHPVNDESIKEFTKMWKSIFHRTIDTKAAEAYLTLQSKQNKKKRTRKNKTMKGGMAPVDYMLRPGIDGTHGNFLPYVSSGLSFYNDINKIAMDGDCGKVDITPTIAADMGSNKVSGGASVSELMSQRLVSSSVPPSVLQDIQNGHLGQKYGDSPNPLTISSYVKAT